MNEVNGVNGTYRPASVAGRLAGVERRPAQLGFDTPTDEVEISELGAMFARLRELPDIRTEKVEQIRAEIEAGAYETSHRLRVTIERLLEELV